MKESKMAEKIKLKLKGFYLTHIKYPNEDNVDDDFQKILQIFYIFGFYQPKPSKGRSAYGALMFSFIMLSHIFGNFKDIFISLTGVEQERNLNKALICAISLTFAIPLKVQIISFARHPTQVIEMIRNLNFMHSREYEDSMNFYRKLCLRLVKFHKYIMASIEFTLITFKLIGFDFFILAIPALYDELACGSFYNLFLFLNVINFTGILMLYNGCDLLHVLCMIRAEANLDFLGKKLRCCADSKDLRENESNLIECVEYHSMIIA